MFELLASYTTHLYFRYLRVEPSDWVFCVHSIRPFVGETAVLPCPSSSKIPPVWRYRKDDDDSAPREYRPKPGKFKPLAENSGNYDMGLTNAQVNDSGLYECIEYGGHGDKHETVVLVG